MCTAVGLRTPETLTAPGGCSSEGEVDTRSKEVTFAAHLLRWEQEMTNCSFSDQQAPPALGMETRNTSQSLPLQSHRGEHGAAAEIRPSQLPRRKDAPSSLGLHRRLPGGDQIDSGIKNSIFRVKKKGKPRSREESERDRENQGCSADQSPGQPRLWRTSADTTLL